MPNILILIVLLQVCTVALVIFLMRRYARINYPIPQSIRAYQVRNAMIEILVLKIRGYLTSVHWSNELLQNEDFGKLTEKQKHLAKQISESSQQATTSLECILESMRGTAKISDFQLHNPTEEEQKDLHKRHGTEEPTSSM